LAGSIACVQDKGAFEFWAVAGRYRLAVVDRDNGLESNEVSIAVHPTEGSLLAARELCGPCVEAVAEAAEMSTSVPVL
jgi:hypothetical protein